ncbi:GvpL/GvpF family gas vesicle protein [Streptomyces sp. NPDC088387]|uniref:GvpL/GvpF family gas vesicle protein n=1 Tax=Streptomyces sp. NPDC088387 TaxID=3365859 RepID=UPI003827C6EF
MSTLRYVYAVCRPFDAALQCQLTGVAGDPPRLLRHHGLVAVVSHVPKGDFAEDELRARLEDTGRLEDADWLAGVARLHQGVVDALTTVTTPLPLRPASVFRDDSAVRLMMEMREDELRRTLDRLEGRVEWGVRVFRDSGAPQEMDPARVSQEKGMTEAPYESPAEDFSARLHTALSGQSDASHTYPLRNRAPDGTGGRNVLNAAYLVPRARSEEFVEIVDRVKGTEPGVLVELTGPSAAYSFAADDF